MNIEYITAAFLVVVFAAAEIYRLMRGRRAVIVREEDGGVPGVTLLVTRVRVRLENGQEVAASMNCCTACLGRLNTGDEVRVSYSSDGYVVDLPWFRRRSCPSRPSVSI